MQRLGYESTTLVWNVYPIHERSDFDILREDLGPRTGLFELWRDYAPFVWVLRNADILLTFFDGGFLQNTPYRWLELGCCGSRERPSGRVALRWRHRGTRLSRGVGAGDGDRLPGGDRAVG